MELYTNSRPSLINENIVMAFDKIINDISNENTGSFKKIYEKIIKPNWVMFAFIFIVGAVLFYRYYVYGRKEKFNKKKITEVEVDARIEDELQKMTEFNKINAEKLTNPKLVALNNNPEYMRELHNFGGMDDPRERIARPTFNPNIPINQQESYVDYMPDRVPVRVNGKLTGNINARRLPYDAPQDNPNNFQYSGPYYRGGNGSGNGNHNNLSDDGYAGFVDANSQNLMEFDDLINSKVNLI